VWHVLGGIEIHNTFVVGKPEGERPLGNPKCRCEENLVIDLNK